MENLGEGGLSMIALLVVTVVRTTKPTLVQPL
jgi:hypothetical protein